MGLKRGCEELANLHTSQTSGFRNCVKGCAHAITTHQAGSEQGSRMDLEKRDVSLDLLPQSCRDFFKTRKFTSGLHREI